MDDVRPDIVDWGGPAPEVVPNDVKMNTPFTPGDTSAHLYRSMIYIHRRKRYDLALAELDEAIRSGDREQPTFFKMRADLYAKLGAYEFAIFSLCEGIDRLGSKDLLIQRACYAYKIGDHPLALRDLNEVTAAVPSIDMALAFLVRGIVYQDLCHDYRLAMVDYNRALSNSWELKGERRRLAEERRQQVLDLLKNHPAE